MSRSDFLLRLMIWLSLTGFAVSAITFQLARGRRRWDAMARLAYTFAFGLLLVHVALAFHFVHHWSQDSAYRETARQTAEVFGLDWGGGLYVNYALMVGWLIDVAWWWRGLEAYRQRPKWIANAWQAFLLFIIFNATVVFAEGVVRWLGLGLCLTLCFLWWFAAKGRPQTRPMKQARSN